MKNLTTMGAGRSDTAQVGEPPKYDLDLGTTKKQFTRKIREKVLKGLYPAEDRYEEQMVRDFKASSLGVKEFLDTWTR
jgi:hypothetical protein